MSRSHVIVRATAAALLSGTLFLAGCSETAPEADPGPTDQKSTPTPTVLAPKAYQRELNSSTEALRVALAGAGEAKDLPMLAKRLQQASRAAATAAEQLRPLPMPEDVQAEHGAFVTALDQLTADLGGVHTAVQDKRLCAPTSALAGLGGTKGYVDLPKAIAGLKAKGYPVRLGGLKAPATQNRRLANGTMILDSSSDALGTLEIDNGGDTDAVITVASGKKPVLTVYVRKGGNVSRDGIPDGNYAVFFSTGKDWDGKTQSFTRDCLFQKFDDPVVFTTTAGSYSVNSLTLHQVIGGNATTSKVDPGDFPN